MIFILSPVVFNKDEVTCFVKRIVKWPFIIIIIVVVVVIVVVALTFDNILRDVENSIFCLYVRPVFLQLTSNRGKWGSILSGYMDFCIAL